MAARQAEWTRRVRELLAEVIDPCSCMASTPVDIVALGLVTGVEVGEDVEVTLALTDPMCLYFIDMAQEIERRVREAGWPGRVRVRYDADDDWTPQRISPAARRFLADRRAERVTLLQLTPYHERPA